MNIILINAIIKTQQWSTIWARLFQTTSSYTTSLRSLLILSSIEIKSAETVKVLAYIRAMPAQISAEPLTIENEGFRVFPQLIQANASN
jgi:hypothetical protein